MQISWQGEFCFTIKSKPLFSEQENNILINPFLPKETGLKLNIGRPNIILLGVENRQRPQRDAFIIDIPGEFEINNTYITGFPAGPSNIIFNIETENINIVYLGSFRNSLEEKVLDKIKKIDILIIPIGGGKTINPAQAAEIINQLEPRLIIPMYYHIPGFTEKTAKLEDFLKDFTLPHETLDKLNIKAKDLPQQDSRLIILNKK